MSLQETEPRLLVNNRSTLNEIHPCYISLDMSDIVSHISLKCVLLYIFLALLSVVTVCGNGLVIISIIYFKQLHVPTNYLILSLAVADLLVGVFIFPFSMTFTVTYCYYQTNLICKIREIFDATLTTASILNLCCISIDRYYAVCQPLTYRSKISKCITVIMILVSWALAAIIGFSFLCFQNVDGLLEERCAIDAVLFTILGSMLSFYIPVFVMLSVYLKIFFVALRQAKSIQNMRAGATVSKMEKKATKTLAIVMGVFILCWTPFFFCFVLQSLIYEINSISVFEALNWITLSNSTLNPFIYAFFYSWFRSAFRIIISGKIFHQDFSNTKLL